MVTIAGFLIVKKDAWERSQLAIFSEDSCYPGRPYLLTCHLMGMARGRNTAAEVLQECLSSAKTVIVQMRANTLVLGHIFVIASDLKVDRKVRAVSV